MNCESYFCTKSLWTFLSILLGCCLISLPYSAFSQTCPRETFRTIDGSCNNLNSLITQNYGAVDLPFLRVLPAYYSPKDIFNGIDFPNRPNPRTVSNVIFNQNEDNGNATNLSSFVFTWGQFLDHDMTFSKGARIESANIPLPPNEPDFTNDISFHRSAIYAGSGIFSAREQENELTAWIDGSQVYGSDTERADWLRTFSHGKLKTSSGNLLPYNTLNGEKNGIIDTNAPEMEQIDNGQSSHFVAGDVRASEQPGLTTLHTLFVREHNRICEVLLSRGYTGDELIYQIARKQVGAIIQSITYEQFLPALGVQLNPYNGYNQFVSPDILNIFATAAFRIGHTMVTSELLLLNDDCGEVSTPLNLEQAFFNSLWIEQYGIDPFIKGLASQQQETIDHKIVDGLRNFLFSIPQLPGSFGLDLAALNIQRGRDHGLPDYRTVRQFYTGQNITSFNQISNDSATIQDLLTLYNSDINEIDLWVGLLAEAHMPNGSMGLTMHEILKTQFQSVRDGDYYYFQNDPFFNVQEKQTLQNTKLGDIIKRNTTLNNLSTNVFYSESCTPTFADCDAIQINALDGQIEIIGLTAPFSTVKVFDKNAGWQVVADCTGTQCGATQLFDVPAGDYFIQITFYETAWQNAICTREADISVIGTDAFSCDKLDIKTSTDKIEITNLTAPFSIAKVYDKNAGWSVVTSCVGGNCGATTIFNLPAGDYFVEVSAYQAAWQHLICTKNADVNIGGINGGNCEEITVTENNNQISVNGLTAPFCTVKVFDVDSGWDVVAECSGEECEESQLFTMGTGNYNVEVTMYQGVWQNQICQNFFPINMSATAANRNKEKLQASVFPNPAQALINLDLREYAGKKASVQIINQFGQVIENLNQLELTKDLIKIPVNDVPNGWYYLTIKVENRLPETRKIMVSRLY